MKALVFVCVMALAAIAASDSQAATPKTSDAVSADSAGDDGKAVGTSLNLMDLFDAVCRSGDGSYQSRSDAILARGGYRQDPDDRYQQAGRAKLEAYAVEVPDSKFEFIITRDGNCMVLTHVSKLDVSATSASFESFGASLGSMSRHRATGGPDDAQFNSIYERLGDDGLIVQYFIERRPGKNGAPSVLGIGTFSYPARAASPAH